MVWIIPSFFSKDEEIENVFQVNLVKVDSAKEILLSRQSHLNNEHPKKYFNDKVNVVQNDFHKDRSQRRSSQSYSYLKKQVTSIDINKADSAEFEQLPAIGEKLSSRIVRYRERLGGFLHIGQIKEVYGISDSAFMVFSPYLKLEPGFVPRKIAINKADYDMLRKHPYADHLFIKLVLAYRKSHGPYTEKREMEKIIQVDRNLLDKIMPYLSFEN